MLVTKNHLDRIHRLIVAQNPTGIRWNRHNWADFLKLLQSRYPVLNQVVQYLIPRFQKTPLRLSRNTGFIFKCTLCGNPAIGTSSNNCICSKGCVKKRVLETIQQSNLSWELDGLRKTASRNANQVYNRIDLTCSLCGNQKTFGFAWLLDNAYDCKCRRSAKISSTHRSKLTQGVFESRVKSRGVQVQFLSQRQDNPGRIHVRCLTCGNKCVTCSQNLLSNRFCRTCGRAKYETTMRETYGENWTHLQAKWMQDGMESKYGNRYALQIPEFFNKMVRRSFKTRLAHFKDRTLHLQGWEPQALRWLTQETNFCKPGDIIHASEDGCPTINYSHGGKDRVYHPDFYVPGRNLVIEVKSWYTYCSNLVLNRLKRDACRDQGFKFKFLIVDVHKNVTVILTPTEALEKWKQQKRPR